MSTQGTIKRYTLILQKISAGTFPNFEILKSHLEEHGFTISPRTLQRDIEQIRNEFGTEINYNRNKNGYSIGNYKEIESGGLLRFFEIQGTAEVLEYNFTSKEDFDRYISFESRGNLKGIENLGLLLPAIKARHKISFAHENYETGIKTKYTLHPYLLREYLNRWYVFGKVEGKNYNRTFGVDRILELIIKKEKFRIEGGYNPKDHFKDIIGLNYSDSEIEKVVLSMDVVQAKYLIALPLHSTQKIEKENENEVVMSLSIRPNYEFKQRIMMLMGRVKVLEPKYLANEMKLEINKMLKNYEDR